MLAVAVVVHFAERYMEQIDELLVERSQAKYIFASVCHHATSSFKHVDCAMQRRLSQRGGLWVLAVTKTFESIFLSIASFAIDDVLGSFHRLSISTVMAGCFTIWLSLTCLQFFSRMHDARLVQTQRCVNSGLLQSKQETALCFT